MANVTPGDVLKLVVKFSHPYYSQIQNVFHMAAVGTDTVDDQQVAATVQDFLGAFYQAVDLYMSSAVSLISWGIDRIVWVGDHWETIEAILDGIDTITGFTPAASGEVLPPAVAGLVLLRPDSLKHSGRKFIAPFTEAYNDADAEAVAPLTSAMANAGAAFFDLYPVDGEDLTLNPVIVSPTQNIYRYVDSVVAKAAWAYQRRRKRYLGI